MQAHAHTSLYIYTLKYILSPIQAGQICEYSGTLAVLGLLYSIADRIHKAIVMIHKPFGVPLNAMNTQTASECWNDDKLYLKAFSGDLTSRPKGAHTHYDGPLVEHICPIIITHQIVCTLSTSHHCKHTHTHQKHTRAVFSSRTTNSKCYV